MAAVDRSNWRQLGVALIAMGVAGVVLGLMGAGVLAGGAFTAGLFHPGQQVAPRLYMPPLSHGRSPTPLAAANTPASLAANNRNG